MQNRTFLVLLRPIFAQKMKTAPPRKGFGDEGVAVIWAEEAFEIGRKIRLNFGKDHFFSEITCFWAEKPFEFPISAEKSVSISVKTFFFLEITCFWAKNPPQFLTNRLTLNRKQWKFGLRLLTVVSLFQKSPPPPFSSPGYAPEEFRRYFRAC